MMHEEEVGLRKELQKLEKTICACIRLQATHPSVSYAEAYRMKVADARSSVIRYVEGLF